MHKSNRPTLTDNVTGLLQLDCFNCEEHLYSFLFEKKRLVVFEAEDGSIYIVDPNYPRTKSGFTFSSLSREDFENRFPYLAKETNTNSIFIYASEEVESINHFLELGTPLVYDEAD